MKIFHRSEFDDEIILFQGVPYRFKTDESARSIDFARVFKAIETIEKVSKITKRDNAVAALKELAESKLFNYFNYFSGDVATFYTEDRKYSIDSVSYANDIVRIYATFYQWTEDAQATMVVDISEAESIFQALLLLDKTHQNLKDKKVPCMYSNIPVKIITFFKYDKTKIDGSTFKREENGVN